MFFAMARFRETKRKFPTTWFLLAGLVHSDQDSDMIQIETG